jgi:hypothetical protein
VEGFSKEVHSVMNVASVVGMTWGGDDNKLLDSLSARERKDKGMRELKNLDCSMSPVKSQRVGGGGGGLLVLNLLIPFPLKSIRGVGLLGVFVWPVLFFFFFFLSGACCGLLCARVGLGCFSWCYFWVFVC